ncbi:MAG: DarT ssDNA thymidine ADP-ribosyltransferase family protein [Acidobacteriota bacterium]|nr:DarT ssDNA thymidine ADP-ribosyltransferase family protein [Acidobacteriota bacterium]
MTRILHFTTNRGVLGILAAGAVKSRKRLPEEQYLEHVYRPNTPWRKDERWIDYVNLSVERINGSLFESSERWQRHGDVFWAVLSFDPVILGHPGVVFATTNNIYPTCCRAEGKDGFEAMFAATVRGRYESVSTRTGLRPRWPTDRQAEVMYPGELSCKHLQQILVGTQDDAVAVAGMAAPLGLGIGVSCAPEVFE